MKVFFFLFIISADHNGYESMTRFDNVNYQSKSQCEKALKKSKVKKNQYLFCGEDYLYFRKR